MAEFKDLGQTFGTPLNGESETFFSTVDLTGEKTPELASKQVGDTFAMLFKVHKKSIRENDDGGLTYTLELQGVENKVREISDG